MKKIVLGFIFLFSSIGLSCYAGDYNQCMSTAQANRAECNATEGMSPETCQEAYDSAVERCEDNIECQSGETGYGSDTCCKEGSYITEEGYVRSNGEICTLKYLECYDIKTRVKDETLGVTYEDCVPAETTGDDEEGVSCTTDDPCLPDGTCVDGLCSEVVEGGSPCTTDEECSAGEECVEDVCSEVVVEGTQCTTNDDCGPDAMCVDSQENPGEKTCITNTEGTMGITMNADCLINGQCSYNIYETLGIRKSDPDPSVTTFVQDIVLGLTMFIGTVVSVILVVSGVLYIMAGIQGNNTLAGTAKQGIINSLIGLLLVVASYSIVRLIQFLATAGGG